MRTSCMRRCCARSTRRPLYRWPCADAWIVKPANSRTVLRRRTSDSWFVCGNLEGTAEAWVGVCGRIRSTALPTPAPTSLLPARTRPSSVPAAAWKFENVRPLRLGWAGDAGRHHPGSRGAGARGVMLAADWTCGVGGGGVAWTLGARGEVAVDD